MDKAQKEFSNQDLITQTWHPNYEASQNLAKVTTLSSFGYS